jgi:hypothetical protein
LEQNIDKIDWAWLSKNENPKAIALLQQNQDKIIMVPMDKRFITWLSLQKLDYQNQRTHSIAKEFMARTLGIIQEF